MDDFLPGIPSNVLSRTFPPFQRLTLFSLDQEAFLPPFCRHLNTRSLFHYAYICYEYFSFQQSYGSHHRLHAAVRLDAKAVSLFIPINCKTCSRMLFCLIGVWSNCFRHGCWKCIPGLFMKTHRRSPSHLLLWTLALSNYGGCCSVMKKASPPGQFYFPALPLLPSTPLCVVNYAAEGIFCKLEKEIIFYIWHGHTLCVSVLIWDYFS